MRPKCKVWLEGRGYIFGDGIASLLHAIDSAGSINKAAASLNMSYRQAWGLVKKTEERLGIRLLDTRVGGGGGGGAKLTIKGRELLRKYDSFRESSNKALLQCFQEAFGG